MFELRIFEVNIVNDLGDDPCSFVIDGGALDQNLHRAPVSDMGEFRFKHVEAYFVAKRLVAFRGHEFESCLRVDKAADQPGGRHTVHMNAFASYPSLPPQAVPA